MKEVELERTYLPKELPAGVLQSRSKEIVDTYLPKGAEHSKIRLRKIGDEYEITKKEVHHADVGKNRVEHTIKLTQEEYAALSTVDGMRLAKTRYYYEEGGVMYEVGVYAGDLAGLVTVDVEFESVEAMEVFTPPSWILTETTQVKELRAGMLCRMKYSDLEPTLTALGYTPIV